MVDFTKQGDHMKNFTTQPNSTNLKNGFSAYDFLLGKFISSVGTALYQLAIYLANDISPINESQYKVSNTKDFVEMIENERIPSAYEMIFLMSPLCLIYFC